MTHAPDLELVSHCLTLWDGKPIVDVAQVMRSWCDVGRGSWTLPNAAPGDTAASHLHEVDLYGVTATGDTPEEAARNWQRAAHNILEASASVA